MNSSNGFVVPPDNSLHEIQHIETESALLENKRTKQLYKAIFKTWFAVQTLPENLPGQEPGICCRAVAARL